MKILAAGGLAFRGKMNSPQGTMGKIKFDRLPNSPITGK